jgi:ATP-binding protein involved in chromosome partitioning
MLIVTTPQPAAQRVAQRAASMAEKVSLQVLGVIENMSWFTGDDGTRYELFGAGGGTTLAERIGVPLLGQIPLLTDFRQGSDVGRPIMATDPEGEAGRALAAIAERVDVELRPKRFYSPGLKLL